MANLSKFLFVLSPQQREAFAEKLGLSQLDPKDWRKRIDHSKQIKNFAKIFSAVTVNKIIAPVFFSLCQDQVAEVRLIAS